ncbi:MAG: DUF4268 domain-containing protein [Capsulimonadales bacterium]|nr:DUF4268 domain-containing protein [Capsulimonadales bacterium]
MATKLRLSQMQRVELRDCWDHEALDFTPWLAQDDNLVFLSEAIGISLELVTIEQNVGRYSADLLCRDRDTGQWVVIENQLEETNHSHLGQLITYVAGVQGSTVIWIARQFTEEHRAAMDWLNEATVQETRFFGIEIELWRIGEGDTVAPRFNVVSRPNDFSKKTTARREATITPTSSQYRYWSAFMERVRSAGDWPLANTRPKDSRWISFPTGTNAYWLSLNTSASGKWINVQIYCNGRRALEYFERLKAQQAAIEADLGPLDWEIAGGHHYVARYRRDSDPADEAQWADQHAWLREQAIAFHKGFFPYLTGETM